MNCLSRLADRGASIVTGVALGVVSMSLAGLGVTFLPVIGVLLAVPVMGLALFFLKAKIEISGIPEKKRAARAEGTMHVTDALPGKAV
jgi:hypothetical protein